MLSRLRRASFSTSFRSNNTVLAGSGGYLDNNGETYTLVEACDYESVSVANFFAPDSFS